MYFKRSFAVAGVCFVIVLFLQQYNNFSYIYIRSKLQIIRTPVSSQPNHSNLDSEENSTRSQLHVIKRKKYPNKKPRFSDIPERFYAETPNVSSHNYKWVINPANTCTNLNEVFLLVAIASASWEFERRNIIRNTWASVRPENKTVVFVFFVGNDKSSNVNSQLQQEYLQHQDIVQEDFLETYKNLTLKTQGQLKWATQFCSNAKYTMHIDDDVAGDVIEIIKQLSNLPSERLLICGKVFKAMVRRDGKWKTLMEEYSSKIYPVACVGWCFVMSQDVVNDLYEMSLDTPLFHLEDVYTTGILREKIGNLQQRKFIDGEKLCQHKGWPKDRPTNDKIIEAWNEMKSKHST